ncbi:MAG: ABC transporter substrate-binding protein [Thermosynechococcaceae cyanobacterium MS004]|nr:ABC transporter substrate-binding protein [Thermosynechococcaceae cyanobacterium MS004]
MKKSGLKTVYLRFCVTILGLTLISCQSPPAGLKIGTLLPISGDLSSYGASMQNTAQLLVTTVNACGGVLGNPVTLFSEDDQTEPAAGAAAMTKLAEVNRVAAVVGGASSAVSNATVLIAVRNQVVQISPSSTSPSFTERARKGEFKGFWFRTAPPDTFQAKAIAQLAYKRGVRSLAVLAVNNDYGSGLINAFIPAFQALGGKVLNAETPTRFDPRAASFDSEVRQAASPRPDAVLLVSYPETGSIILRTAFELGVLGQNTQWIATDGLKDQRLAELVGKSKDRKYIVAGLEGTAAHAAGNAFKDFRDRFVQAYKTEPAIYDPNTWDAMALTVLAAESAKSLTGTGIRDHLRTVSNPPGEAVTDVCQGLDLLRKGKKINYQGASGTVDLNQQGDVVGSYDIWQIQPNGSIKILETLEIKH